MAFTDPEINLRLQNIGEQDGLTHDIGEAAFHLRSPFPERLAKHNGKIYLVGTGSNVASWLTAAVQARIGTRPLSGGKQTF